ncbi:MAG: hypothetical protein JRC90_04750 [Deltaproteobacteria bacterium]|nr:hypothetical protein [Deltaproteobacteria bacterium]
MPLHLPEALLTQHARAEEALQEIRQLRLKSRLSLKDLRQIAKLRVEIAQLSPPERYGWIDGRPRIDILAELVKIDRQTAE